MAKGYLVDNAQRCIRFRAPGQAKRARFAISFDTLAQCFGALPPEQAFTRNRKSVLPVAEGVLAADRLADADGWLWILARDCVGRAFEEITVTDMDEFKQYYAFADSLTPPY